MKNGCPECEKLIGIDNLCDKCELGMLQCTAEAAMHDYVNKVNEILKEKQNDYQNNVQGSGQVQA